MTHKVCMFPTPIEAATNDTNAIHQIVLQLAKHLPAFGYEVVDNPDDADLIAGHAGETRRNIPVDVAHCHGLLPTALPGAEAWHFGVNQEVIRNLLSAREITVPSQWVADILRRDMHVDPHVIGWAIEPGEWLPDIDHGGWVLWNKTRADSVCDPTPMLKLAERLPAQRFISTFGDNAPSNVRVIGRQPRARMREWIGGAEVYLATTRETFGISTLEALASGVPVLGYRWAGTADLVTHGVTGYLVEPGDVEGLVEGLAYCKQHRALLGANARQVALAHTWERVAQQIADVYGEALQPHDGPKVSVVIPTYNYARFLPGAISGAVHQDTNFEYEIIVVNDGSTDHTEALLGEIRNPQIHCFTIANQGVSAARNYGIRHARGEYIVCLDADDHIGHPAFLQTLADALDADRSLGIAFTGLTIMTEAGKLSPVPHQWPSGYDYDLQVAGQNQIPSACMFRKSAWQRAGGYRSNFEPCEDARLWLQIGALGYRARQVTTEGWYHYRLHPNSLSVRYRAGHVAEPDWRAGLPWIKDGRRPFASDGKPYPNPHSWPVRNYDQPVVGLLVMVENWTGIAETLDSIEAQTERRWICLVVDLVMTETTPDLTAYPWANIVASDSSVWATCYAAPYHYLLASGERWPPNELARRLKAEAKLVNGPVTSEVSSGMVRIEYTWSEATDEPRPVIGMATHTNYRARAKGDVFFVWRSDYEAMIERFTPLSDFALQLAKTPVPPEPILIGVPTWTS